MISVTRIASAYVGDGAWGCGRGDVERLDRQIFSARVPTGRGNALWGLASENPQRQSHLATRHHNPVSPDQKLGQIDPMTHINIAEAKAHLSDLIARAEAGETILISRRGTPIVELRAIQQPRQSLDVEALRGFITTLPPTPAGTVEAMRDEARY